MKKALCTLLAIVFLLSLAACGGGDDTGGGSSNGSNSGNNSGGGAGGAGNSPANNSPGESAGTDNTPVAEPLSEAFAWWDGEWYGFWKIPSADYAYSDYEGGKWDCYAIIDVEADGTAVVYLWDDGMALGLMTAMIYPDGGGVMGGLTSEGGELFSYPSERADWVINPSFSAHDNMIVIQEWFEDTDGDGFRYEIFLRPWGMLWDDVPAGERPPDYDSWYKGKNAYTRTMLDGLYEPDGGVFVHPRLLEGSTGGSTGGGGGGGGAAPGGGGGGGGAVLSGPTAELKLGVGDVYSLSYPTDSYDFSDTFGAKLGAKDGSVAIYINMQKSNESLDDINAFLDSYGSFEGYSSEKLTIAGFEARRITYKDWGGELVSKVFIIFNTTGGIGGYHGVIFEIMSEKDFAATWTSEIRAILETSKAS